MMMNIKTPRAATVQTRRAGRVLQPDRPGRIEAAVADSASGWDEDDDMDDIDVDEEEIGPMVDQTPPPPPQMDATPSIAGRSTAAVANSSSSSAASWRRKQLVVNLQG